MDARFITVIYRMRWECHGHNIRGNVYSMCGSALYHTGLLEYSGSRCTQYMNHKGHGHDLLKEQTTWITRNLVKRCFHMAKFVTAWEFNKS
jgi:hypothetical protein